MKRIIIFLAALAFATQASAIYVSIDNNTGSCNVNITVTPVDAACASTATPASITAMPPGHTFEIVDGTGAVDFQIDITVIDKGGNKIMNTFYTDGSAACTGGVVSGTTGVVTNCNGAVVNATVTGGGGTWTVSIN